MAFGTDTAAFKLLECQRACDAKDADIAQLRADLAEAKRELDEAIEDRRQARDDAARAAALLAVRTMEQDARPAISREDAARVASWMDAAIFDGIDESTDPPAWAYNARDALRAHAAGVDASARFRARADRCDPVEVPVLAAGVDAPCLVCHLPDGQHRMSCYQRYRDAREKAERVAVEAELRSPVGPAAHAIGGNESPRAPIDLAAEASDGGAFGPVSDWLSKVPSIKRESLGTWRANDCAACEGSGYANVRASAAGARTCPACKGTGRKEGTDA